MSVTKTDLEKIAQLARLHLREEEKALFLTQLNEILGYVEKLSELDTDGLEPMAHSLDLENVTREDELQPSLSSEEALKNAPEKSNGYFKVPKVVSR